MKAPCLLKNTLAVDRSCVQESHDFSYQIWQQAKSDSNKEESYLSTFTGN